MGCRAAAWLPEASSTSLHISLRQLEIYKCLWPNCQVSVLWFLMSCLPRSREGKDSTSWFVFIFFLACFYIASHCVVPTGLELKIFLLQPPKCCVAAVCHHAQLKTLLMEGTVKSRSRGAQKHEKELGNVCDTL